MGHADNANGRWATMLGHWSIPEDLVAAAPQSPYFFDPNVFIVAADAALARDEDTPSDAAAREVLLPGATVVDVGVGAGTASLRLGAAHVIGVDTSRELLDAFVDRAGRHRIGTTVIEGRWPDLAPQTPVGDVVVCHHVVYNAPDLSDFAAALSDHARIRVVVELTTTHPMAWMTPYWKALHDLGQPSRPTVDDAIDVLIELGLDVHERRWEREIQMIGENDADQLARIARRLCLPPARHTELRRVVEATPPPRTRQIATLWWDRQDRNRSRHEKRRDPARLPS